MKNIPLSLILCFSLGSAFGQSAILDAYIQEGLRNNLVLKQQNLDIQKSMEAVRQAKALFYPTLSFNASYTLAAGGRQSSLPIGDLLNPVYSTLNQITQTSAFPQVENQVIQFLPNNFQETKLKFAYPLYNSDLKFNRQIKELLVQSKEAQRNAYEQELRYEMTGAYLQYIKALEAEKIWYSAQTVYVELKRFNESLVRNNVATRDIVASADYELSKVDNELFQLKSNQNTARAYFNFLINKDLQADVIVDTLLLKSTAQVYNGPELVQQATQKRQEFAALQAGMDASSTAVKLQEANKRLPDAYIGGETGFQGFGYNWFNGTQAFVLAQVGITYDIYDGGLQKSKIQEAKIERQKLQAQYDNTQQQIALQITQSLNALDAARNGWRSAQNGQYSAEVAYKIIANKYKANQVLLLELLDAQNRVTTSKLQVLLAWNDVLIKEAELRKAAGL
jgi:outer membrane protein TolC